MRTAVRLTSLNPGADLPDPAFVGRLGRRLRLELAGEVDDPRVSRRSLLAAAGTTAAAAVVGGIAGVAGDRLIAGTAADRELVPAGAAWQPVIAASAVAAGQAVRFSTSSVDGFVVNRGGRFEAVSGICTHLGCRLQSAAGHLACPCHRTAFSMEGAVMWHVLPQAPPALPTLRTRVRDGQVEVFA
jgi:nitrite reductase/ring-hydroxylating ferredoxin subunit